MTEPIPVSMSQNQPKRQTQPQGQQQQIPKEVQDLFDLKGSIIDSAVGRSNGVINDAISLYLQRAAALMIGLIQQINALTTQVASLESERKASDNPKKVRPDDGVTPTKK